MHHVAEETEILNMIKAPYHKKAALIRAKSSQKHYMGVRSHR